MAFNPINITYGVRTTLGQFVWNYFTSDNISDVEGGGYFAGSLSARIGDILRVTANDGNTIYQIRTFSFEDGLGLTKLANVTSFTSL